MGMRQAARILFVTALLLAGCSAGPARTPAAGKPGEPAPAAAGADRAAGRSAPARPDGDYFAGKTITVLVNSRRAGPRISSPAPSLPTWSGTSPGGRS